MSNLRTGTFGNYYGSFYNESSSLTLEEMQVNATYLCKAFISKGWTKNAIAGMLGNMQSESSINPGRWQSEDVGNTSLGYGLVQWTPATKYLNWCTEASISDPSEMDSAISRIIYELENNIQWIATEDYNFSFSEFSKSTESAEYLASSFLKNYERAGIEVEETRRSNATYWFNYIKGIEEEEPIKRKKKKFKFLLFNRNIRNRRIIN